MDGIRVKILECGHTSLDYELALKVRRMAERVARYLERHGPGLHHLCLTVTNLPAAIQAAERANLQLVDPTPSHDSDGTRVFLHPRAAGGVLIGLVEPHATGVSWADSVAARLETSGYPPGAKERRR